MKPIDPIADHIYSPWTVETAPTCEEPGTQTCRCDFCGGVKAESIPATGHDFSGGTTCANGCGTVNPDFIVPDKPSDPTEETEHEN